MMIIMTWETALRFLWYNLLVFSDTLILINIISSVLEMEYSSTQTGDDSYLRNIDNPPQSQSLKKQKNFLRVQCNVKLQLSRLQASQVPVYTESQYRQMFLEITHCLQLIVVKMVFGDKRVPRNFISAFKNLVQGRTVLR